MGGNKCYTVVVCVCVCVCDIQITAIWPSSEVCNDIHFDTTSGNLYC